MRLDATEIQVRRPAVGQGRKRVFLPGGKQNTMKVTVIADRHGRTLWTDTLRTRTVHDGTAGISNCSGHFVTVEVSLDDDHLGLSRNQPGQSATDRSRLRTGRTRHFPLSHIDPQGAALPDGAGGGPKGYRLMKMIVIVLRSSHIRS
ncbi:MULTISPECIES: hypothetical protein [unclassified Streptomyces]|uniref:hypothetical protein n=1 Tax=unclassified Streptomyces TaxID=2593676 RepID=UPI000939E171|nr:hypothetical protein [Streptomyces sp. CB02400]